MLYYILKPLVKLSILIFFRKIHVRGLENLKPGEPVLVAANHTNAFLDPMVFLIFLSQPVYTLARGDVFKKPIFNWILNRMKIYPIYRLQEGADNLHKNAKTFQICNKLFKQKNTVMIFPEGVCIQQRRLCKLKKGAAKMVFGAEEDFNYQLGLKVVPVGINYSSPSKFGGTLFVNIGRPIEVSKYLESYKTDKARTVNKLTEHLETKMRRLIVDIDQVENHHFISQVEQLYNSELTREHKKQNHSLRKGFVASRHIVKAAKDLQANDSFKYEELKQKVNEYFKLIGNNKLSEKHMKPEYQKKAKTGIILSRIILLALTFPIHLAGVLINYVPFKLPHYLTKKIVKNIEFFSSVNIGFGMFIFLVYYLFCGLAVYCIFDDYRFGLAFFVIAPLSGLFSLNWWKLFRELQGLMKVKVAKHSMENLLRERNRLIAQFNLIKKNYLRK